MEDSNTTRQQRYSTRATRGAPGMVEESIVEVHKTDVRITRRKIPMEFAAAAGASDELPPSQDPAGHGADGSLHFSPSLEFATAAEAEDAPVAEEEPAGTSTRRRLFTWRQQQDPGPSAQPATASAGRSTRSQSKGSTPPAAGTTSGPTATTVTRTTTRGGPQSATVTTTTATTTATAHNREELQQVLTSLPSGVLPVLKGALRMAREEERDAARPREGPAADLDMTQPPQDMDILADPNQVHAGAQPSSSDYPATIPMAGDADGEAAGPSAAPPVPRLVALLAGLGPAVTPEAGMPSEQHGADASAPLPLEQTGALDETPPADEHMLAAHEGAAADESEHAEGGSGNGASGSRQSILGRMRGMLGRLNPARAAGTDGATPSMSEVRPEGEDPAAAAIAPDADMTPAVAAALSERAAAPSKSVDKGGSMGKEQQADADAGGPSAAAEKLPLAPTTPAKNQGPRAAAKKGSKTKKSHAAEDHAAAPTAADVEPGVAPSASTPSCKRPHQDMEQAAAAELEVPAVPAATEKLLKSSGIPPAPGRKLQKSPVIRHGRIRGRPLPGSKRVMRSEKAGLVFPVSRVHRAMKEDALRISRVGAGAPVYLAAVLEYLTAELLEVAGDVAADLGRRRITPRHMALAVRGDPEFSGLLAGAVLPAGGVVPHVEPKNKKPKAA